MKQTPRDGQTLAVACVIDRWTRDEKYTSLVIPTRYGKSDIARMCALIGVEQHLIACTLVLSPSAFLADQFVLPYKWRECLARFDNEWLKEQQYGALGFQPKYARLDRPKLRPNANGEHVLSATIQLIDAQSNRQFWPDWVRSVRHLTGLPVAVIVDESHMGSEANSWGSSLKDLVDAGAYALLLTATPERADGERITGFTYEQLSEKAKTVIVTKPGPRPELVQVDIMEGTKRAWRLKADFEVSFQQAFDENALARLGRVPFDVDLDEVALGSYTGMLSDLPPSRVAGALDKLVRHPDVIREGCQRLVRNLRHYRITESRTLAIVFCGNDDIRHGATKGEAKHLNQVVDELARQAPDLRTEIFTSADDDAGQKLLDFADGRGADVAIVKQMAGLGLDSRLLKIGLDLSTVRQFATSAQRMMRVGTPDPPKVMVACWIAPADVLATAILDRLVKNEGGEATVIDDLVVIETLVVPRKEHDSELWRVNGIQAGDFDDSHFHHGDADEYAQVVALVDAFPKLRVLYTDAEIAVLGRSVFTPNHENATARDTGAQAAALRLEINEDNKKATAAIIQMRKLSWDDFGIVSKKLWTDTYRATGWPTDDKQNWVKLDQNNDLRELRAVRDAMQEALADILRRTS